jgi:hypothetical protein
MSHQWISQGDEIAKGMTPDQVKQAQLMVQAFTPRKK